MHFRVHMLMIVALHVCSSATHAPYNAGGEQNVQEHLDETPASVTLDVKTPHFPDAVLPDVKVNPEDKLATESAKVSEER